MKNKSIKYYGTGRSTRGIDFSMKQIALCSLVLFVAHILLIVLQTLEDIIAEGGIEWKQKTVGKNKSATEALIG